jgi:hypothetical protein
MEGNGIKPIKPMKQRAMKGPMKRGNNKTKKFGRMNCAPIVRGKTINNFSCFTKDIIIKLKDSYNKHHPSQPITETSPSKLWGILKQKMSYCSKESCWLDILDNPQDKKKIEKYLFAPKKPAEWKRNPREWLSTIEILEVLDQYQKAFPEFLLIGPTTIDFDTKIGGVCVCPELCNFSLQKCVDLGKRKFGIVYNLDNSNGRGTHWVSHFIDLDDKFQFYFNSSGSKIPPEIKAFVDRVDKQSGDMGIQLEFYEMFSDESGRPSIEHQMQNTECGMYCLFFIITMLLGETDTKVGNGKDAIINGKKRKFRNKKEKIEFFKREARIPDNHVAKYRDTLFND